MQEERDAELLGLDARRGGEVEPRPVGREEHEHEQQDERVAVDALAHQVGREVAHELHREAALEHRRLADRLDGRLLHRHLRRIVLICARDTPDTS